VDLVRAAGAICSSGALVRLRPVIVREAGSKLKDLVATAHIAYYSGCANANIRVQRSGMEPTHENYIYCTLRQRRVHCVSGMRIVTTA